MNNKKTINNIIDIPIMDKYDIKMSDSDIKNMLNIFDNSIYNKIFREQIIIRGEEYAEKVINVNKKNNTYTCNIIGKDYKVSVSFDKNTIKDASCTCPYSEKYKDYCKHVYGLVYAIKCKDNKNIIITEVNNIDIAARNMIEKANNYTSSHKLKDDIIKEYKAYTKYYYNEIVAKSGVLNFSSSEDVLFKFLKKIINITSLLRLNMKRTLSNKNIDKIIENTHFINNGDTTINIDIIIDDGIKKKRPLSLIERWYIESKMLSNKVKQNKNNNQNYLEDWQQELVDKGMYAETSFEENEELEEDDYYYEDE